MNLNFTKKERENKTKNFNTLILCYHQKKYNSFASSLRVGAERCHCTWVSLLKPVYKSWWVYLRVSKFHRSERKTRNITVLTVTYLTILLLNYLLKSNFYVFLYSGENGTANILVLWKGSCGTGQKEVSTAVGHCNYWDKFSENTYNSAIFFCLKKACVFNLNSRL